MLKELLNNYADEGNERLGFVLEDGTILETFNNHDDPEFGAMYRSADLFAYVYDPDRLVSAVATWHTHPSATNNLSGDDYVAFTNHPHLEHYIVGKNGVAKYYVTEDGVVKHG